jgi:hypothetical protein
VEAQGASGPFQERAKSAHNHRCRLHHGEGGLLMHIPAFPLREAHAVIGMQIRMDPATESGGHRCSGRRLAMPRGADGMEGLGFGLGVEYAIAASESGKPTAAMPAGLRSVQAIGLRSGSL